MSHRETMRAVKLFHSSVRNDLVSIENFIEFSDNIFRFITFDFKTISRGRKPKENVKILLQDIFFWFSAINVCLFVSLSAVNTFKNSTGMKALTFAMPLLTSTSLVIVKCLTVYCNKSNISEILDSLKIIFPKGHKLQKNFKIERYLKSYKTFVRVYAFLFMVPCLSVIAIPLFKHASTGTTAFPLNIWLPIEFYRRDVYAVCFIWAIWSCLNSVIILIAIDTLMFVLITLISMEFDILEIDFMNLKSIGAPEVSKRARALIQRHNCLIALSVKLEKVFSPSFLFNFVQSSFVICLTAFQYTTSSEATQFLFNGSYCAATLNQIWLLCYFGQKIIDSSARVGNGAYDCSWENSLNLKVGKALIMILRRAQTSTKLTAMNFADISLQSFMNVRKVSN